ncbi:extended synaptotagmin-1-like isoform X2 [Dreissena polymorpha]|uniref:extended synaptotagmin-1-like isoform X2 n=1 Tax=Dreissena polymorpha TaxID=45954 RepID=UPI002264ACD6|nr:extended synaptotagmin-1-like isoform X2 [Dreissena polymorpha]
MGKVQNQGAIAPNAAVNQVMGLYIIVSFTIALSWFLGAMNCSFLWVFAMIFGLFIVWKTRLRDVVEKNLEWHRERFHRKRALKQEETTEWLNFLINRWWVFSSISIEDLVKRRINERLVNVKPSFIGHLELTGFTFGDLTPSFRSIKAFECSDGVRGFKPVSWSSVLQPPVGLHKMSSFQIVLEADIAAICEEFRMVFKARAGTERLGLNFDIAVEDLKLKGILQAIVHMSMDIPFPHITKATVSFSDTPEVWFNVTVLKALQLMEVPLIKSWIHLNVMEGITNALVDPSKIDILFTKVGPVSSLQNSSTVQQEPAQGVLTIQITGTPSADADEEIHYTRLRLGKCKRQTLEVPATQGWEDCCSFFVHSLVNEKLSIKHKCKRLLTTVTLEQHDLSLSSFSFSITKQITHEITNSDGSKLQLMMDYSPLPPVNLEQEEIVNVLQRSGVMYVCVHCANNVAASDKTGSSDPYCVVFCDRRRVLTTPYLAQTLNPRWESHAEFFVKDFSQCNLSFYVFDWDGTNSMDDDFLGSAHHAMSEKEPYVLKRALVLGCNKQGMGHMADESLGQVVVSITFRPVSSVEKSERYRLSSTDSANNNEFLYVEDMVSPCTMVLDVFNRKRSLKGGGKKLARQKSTHPSDEFMKDKIFVDLTLIQAKELVAMDRNGYSDPFCEVRMGEEKLFSTSVKKKTLTPMWNESVTLKVPENCGMLEIQLFDKDMFVNDFLGKVMLTLDQLKELSLRKTSDWFPLKHTKSGQLQIKCTVTALETTRKDSGMGDMEPLADSSNSASSLPVNNSASRKGPQGDEVTPIKGPQGDDITPKKGPARELSLENEVFEETIQQVTNTQRPTDNGVYPRRRSGRQTNGRGDNSPLTSTPMKEEGTVTLRRSASDVNMDKRRSHTNSVNSLVAFNDLNISTAKKKLKVVRIEKDALGHRLFNVTGKVLSIQGLKGNEGKMYCKVRVIAPHKHRLRKIFGNRVIAKSPLIKATQPMVNLAMDIDRGLGVSGETLLQFDIKKEGKEHLVSKAYTIKSLFSGEGGEGDKIQKVLPLERNISVEVFLQHVPKDQSTFNRHSQGRMTLPGSFRK